MEKCRYQYQQVKRKGSRRLERITCYNCMYADTKECKKEQEKWLKECKAAK